MEYEMLGLKERERERGYIDEPLAFGYIYIRVYGMFTRILL